MMSLLRIHTRAITLFAAAALCMLQALAIRPAGEAERLGYTPGDTCVTIPARIKAIPDFCFAGCEGLTAVRFENGSLCSRLGEYCFAECADLREISLPGSLASIGEGAFRECRSLKNLSIPSQVTALPKEMCHRCVALESIGLPPRLQEVGSFALAGCETLKRLDLPASVVKIGSNAFSNCLALVEAEVPPATRQLESYAFAGCTSLRRLTLPQTPNMLGELITSGCTSLTQITEPAPVPPTFDCGSYLFEPDDAEAYARCTLRVNKDCIPAYSKAAGWELFRSIKPIYPKVSVPEVPGKDRERIQAEGGLWPDHNADRR